MQNKSTNKAKALPTEFVKEWDKFMDLYEIESKIKELEASYNKEADKLMQELNAYKKKNPILPLYGDDPNVDKMIANKNRIIRSQYTRRENKVHKLWEKFYDDVTDVAKLVVQQVRDRDIGRSELTSYLDHYAIFAEAVLDAVLWTSCESVRSG